MLSTLEKPSERFIVVVSQFIEKHPLLPRPRWSFFGSCWACRLFPFSGALQGIWQWSADNNNFLNSFPLHCHISSFFRHVTPEKRPELWNSTSLHHIQSLMHTNSAFYCFFGHSASQPVTLLCYSSVSTPLTFSETATMPTLPFCPFPLLPRSLMYTTMQLLSVGSCFLFREEALCTICK